MERTKSIKHMGIYVREFEAMISFYRDVLGFVELTRYDDQGAHIDTILKTKGARVQICKLVSPFGKEKGQGDMLELICFPQNDKEPIVGELFAPGMSHIGLGVDDIHKLCQNICENGGRMIVEPMEVAGNGNYLAFCQDIEGNYLELIENK